MAQCRHPRREQVDNHFVCEECGRHVTRLPLEFGFRFPDPIYAIAEKERMKRCELGEDFCSLDQEQFFVRGMVGVPVDETDEFCFGIWLEVSREDQSRLSVARANTSAGEVDIEFEAKLANTLPVSDGWLGAPVRARARGGAVRPYVLGCEIIELDRLLSEGWDWATYRATARTLLRR